MNSFELIAYPLLPIFAMELLLGFLLLTHSTSGRFTRMVRQGSEPARHFSLIARGGRVTCGT